ncbi:uncharacterized protein CBL_21371, partial [Carabus blaptoides fortunei]
ANEARRAGQQAASTPQSTASSVAQNPVQTAERWQPRLDNLFRPRSPEPSTSHHQPTLPPSPAPTGADYNQSNYYVALSSVKENREKRRKLWQKEWLKRRDIGFGALHLLHEELRLEDKTSFKSFLRMNEDCFMLLLSKVEHKIGREDTKFRESVKPRYRLSITLRFLATGESFQSLSYSFRVGRTTIGLIVTDSINAIFECMKDEYIKSSVVELLAILLRADAMSADSDLPRPVGVDSLVGVSSLLLVQLGLPAASVIFLFFCAGVIRFLLHPGLGEIKRLSGPGVVEEGPGDAEARLSGAADMEEGAE